MAPTALIVDQNADTGGKLAYWLTTLGVPATVVGSADEAEVSLHGDSAPRLVVVSNELPDMERFACLRHQDPVLSRVVLMVILGGHGHAADPRLDPTWVVVNPPEDPDFIAAVSALRDAGPGTEASRVH
jgi:DNA-binding NtrC family response regulator